MKHAVLLAQTEFTPDRLPATGGGTSELRYDCVSSQDVINLIKNIEYIKSYYDNKRILDGILVSVFYKNITPKTARISTLFFDSVITSFKTTVGARYEQDGSSYKHVVTHYIPRKQVDVALSMLTTALEILNEHFDGIYLKQYSKRKNDKIGKILFDKRKMAKTLFMAIMKDVSEVSKFDVLFPKLNNSTKIISFFPCFSTNNDLRSFLEKTGIVGDINILDKNTAILTKEQIDVLNLEAPYVISMGSDFSSYVEEELKIDSGGIESIVPEPDESLPVIGVFDTYFDDKSFFKNFVDVVDLIKDKHNPSSEDYYHGSKIDSILVMGHVLNGTKLNDGCGFFKVKHFVVGWDKYIDFEVLYKNIETVVSDHCASIKVWNLSLGDRKETNPNYISLLGAKIDEISRKYNVLFVVSGTNLDDEFKQERIGGPADSLNALVVNSVDFEKNIPDYARRGPALTFNQKPDISYFGGTKEKPLVCYSPNPNDCFGCGTSFSAPYIARKCAYLVHVAKVPIQCAKAMIIDSAYGWGCDLDKKQFLGYGVPDTNISDIINSKRDEIKFIFYGQTKNQHTYINDFPILLEKISNRFNYRVKLVFSYFTFGERNLGVDYAQQDISIGFGHTYSKPYKSRGGIEYHTKVDNVLVNDMSISNIDYAGEPIKVKDWGKWNNTKVFVEKIRSKGKKYEDNEKWGIMVTHLERLGTVSNEEWVNSMDEHSVKFGMVITFKTIDGTDARYNDFYELVNNNLNYILRPLDVEIDNPINIQEEKKIDID